jgi:histidinol-phosphatase (PHP family)
MNESSQNYIDSGAKMKDIIIPYAQGDSVLREYHTHTHFCDGDSSPAQMAAAAYSRGVAVYGFSTHTPLPYHTSWAASVEGYAQYKAEVRALKEEYRGKMEILLGAEYDLDSGELDLSDLDYVIGSAHQLRGADRRVLEIDGRAEYIELLETYGRAGLVREYYKGVVACAVRPQIDIVGHFDLITKYGVDLDRLPFYRSIALDAVRKILSARPEIIFEINTGGMFRAGKTAPYPALFILKEIKRCGGRVVITSDAHSPEALLFERERAQKLAAEAGF